MRYERYDLEVVQEAEKSGAALAVGHLTNVVVRLVADTGDTIQVQVNQLDADPEEGDDGWTDYGDAATSETLPVHVEGAWSRLRIHTAAKGEDTTSAASLSAHNHRSH
jgi:hypothetical protein